MGYEALDPFVRQHPWLENLVESQSIELLKRNVRPLVRVLFKADIGLESIVTLLALWKIGAAACPISSKLPIHGQKDILRRLAPAFALDTPKQCVCNIPQNIPYFPLLLSTSGSTGTPKIAAFSLKNLLISAREAADYLKITQEDTWYLSLPLYHVSGIGALLRSLLSGASFSFSLSESNFISLVPTQLYRFFQQGTNLSKYKAVIVGGAPLSASLLKESLSKKLPLYTTWGMTETSSMVTLGLADETGHSGSILPSQQLKIDDTKEILVQGETLFQGYLSEENTLLTARRSNGWFPTKDLGKFDSKKRLLWQGRKDLLFISLGENIQPEEIEALLLQMQDVYQAIVVGVPHEECGTIPVAFIEQKFPIVKETIHSVLREYVSPFKIPRYIFPLPANSAHKPSRADLKKHAVKLVNAL